MAAGNYGIQGTAYYFNGKRMRLMQEMHRSMPKEYTGNKTIQEILEELFTDYLTGYTVNYLSTNTDKPTIKWEDKPINDCIYDLSKLADADTYVNDSLVLQFFDKKSILFKGIE